MSEQRGALSFGKLALFSLGAATAVLLLTTILLAALQPGPVVGLVIGLVGVAAAIAAMGTVSTRMTRRAFGDDEPHPGGSDEPDPGGDDEPDPGGNSEPDPGGDLRR